VRVEVNGTRLWFDVDGPALVPDGSLMRERPTLILVHGGPGSYDHSHFRPHFARLTAVAQHVYLDLRGPRRTSRPSQHSWRRHRPVDGGRRGRGLRA
jgi:pimeloyl-ACP methyl ester carboxylesterase